MKLTDIAELVAGQLNETKDLWKPDTWVVKAVPCIDWVVSLGEDGPKVLVVPELNQYLLQGERKVVTRLQKQAIITIHVGYTFTHDELHYSDVAPWETTKLVIDAREAIEEVVATTNYSPQRIACEEIESQPVLEEELNKRNFNASTSFYFEDIQCGSRHELESSLMSSNANTTSPEMRASLRRAALSEKRLGRR